MGGQGGRGFGHVLGSKVRKPCQFVAPRGDSGVVGEWGQGEAGAVPPGPGQQDPGRRARGEGDGGLSAGSEQRSGTN